MTVVDHRLDLLTVGDIGLDGDRIAPEGADRCRDLLGLFAALGVVDRHISRPRRRPFRRCRGRCRGWRRSRAPSCPAGVPSVTLLFRLRARSSSPGPAPPCRRAPAHAPGSAASAASGSRARRASTIGRWRSASSRRFRSLRRITVIIVQLSGLMPCQVRRSRPCPERSQMNSWNRVSSSVSRSGSLSSPASIMPSISPSRVVEVVVGHPRRWRGRSPSLRGGRGACTFRRRRAARPCGRRSRDWDRRRPAPSARVRAAPRGPESG